MFDELVRTLVPISAHELVASLDKAIVFGAGSSGISAKQVLEKKSVEVRYFVDNNKSIHGTVIDGLSVQSPSNLLKDKDIAVLIASDWSKEIAVQLREMKHEHYFYFGFCFDYERWIGHFSPNVITENLNKLEQVYHLLEDDLSRQVFASIVKFRLTLDPEYLIFSSYDQYFHSIVRPVNHDVIIDGGAWIGDSATAFGNQLKGDCHIFSFEPTRENYDRLIHNISKEHLSDTVRPVNAGLWSNSCQMSVDNTLANSMQYQVSEGRHESIRVVDLDSFVQDEETVVNLVKMDIEGSEIEALKGAQRTLSEQKPKLQISIYHRPDDLWKIPLLINNINSDYKFYLGHHSQHLFDTVLYATGE